MPSAFVVPGLVLPPKIISLPSTWQVPSLLISSLVCGPRAAVIATVAYLTLGLYYLPVFHDGGSLNYLTTPGFGYLIGFIPAAWISGRIIEKSNTNDLIYLTLCALAGVIIIQIWGGIYLIFRFLIGSLSDPLPELFFRYSIAPLPAQISLCPAVGIISLLLRRILLIA